MLTGWSEWRKKLRVFARLLRSVDNRQLFSWCGSKYKILLTVWWIKCSSLDLTEKEFLYRPVFIWWNISRILIRRICALVLMVPYFILFDRACQRLKNLIYCIGGVNPMLKIQECAFVLGVNIIITLICSLVVNFFY